MENSAPATIAIIVINYKKPELTVGLCRSLALLPGHEHTRVVVVDNAADESSRLALRTLPGESGARGLAVEVLHEPTNWGYFGGARVGLSHLRRSGLADWVIISNSDIEFTDPDFLRALSRLRASALATPEAAAAIGVIGPKIFSGLSGTNQNPYMPVRPPRARMQFYKWIFRFTITCFLYQFLGLAKSKVKSWLGRQPSEPAAMDIYAPHGAFLIFSREYFARGGDFAHGPFLFGEEVTVAETCRRLGLRARYEPALAVSHIEHASIGVFPSRAMLKFQAEASTFCADTYFRND